MPPSLAVPAFSFKVWWGFGETHDEAGRKTKKPRQAATPIEMKTPTYFPSPLGGEGKG